MLRPEINSSVKRILRSSFGKNESGNSCWNTCVETRKSVFSRKMLKMKVGCDVMPEGGDVYERFRNVYTQAQGN